MGFTKWSGKWKCNLPSVNTELESVKKKLIMTHLKYITHTVAQVNIYMLYIYLFMHKKT